MTAEKLRPDPGMDENRDNLRFPRDATDVIDEIDVMIGQTLGKKRPLVVLGFDKNNFHPLVTRNAFAPAVQTEFNPGTA